MSLYFERNLYCSKSWMWIYLLKKILSLGNVLVLWEKFLLSLYFLDRPTSLLKENWGFTDILTHTWDLVYYNNYGGMFLEEEAENCGRFKKDRWHICALSTVILFLIQMGFFFNEEFLNVCTVILELKSAHHEYWFEQTSLHQTRSTSIP